MTLSVLSISAGGADSPPRPADRRGSESIAGPDGRRIPGRITGDLAGGFRFAPEQGEPIPLVKVGEVLSDREGAEPAEAVPPFQVRLGLGQRLSGRLGEIGAAEVRLEEGPARRPVSVARAGVLALVQRPGAAQVLRDDFETLDPRRWTVTGLPEVVAEPRLSGDHGLRLPAGGASATCRLSEPVDSGHLEIAFLDDAARVARQRWFLDLSFRDGDSLQTIRVVPGWIEETLAVESPRGPTLSVQRLLRRPGWHRLVVRFGPDQTDLVIDGDELAHGDGPAGPLVEVRLATEPVGIAEAPARLAAHLDDLRLSRLAEPAGPPEVDPTQDAVQLLTGDQLFGRVLDADADRVRLEINGRCLDLGWSEVAGLRFRRAPAPSAWIEGLLIRAEWRPAAVGDARDLDRIEGILASVQEDSLFIQSPYAGTVAVPRDRLRRVQILGPTRRLVLDPFPHHLGNRVDEELDPPQPEGGRLDLEFTLDRPAPAPGAGALVLDVVKVVGESGNLDFSDEVREGFLRTHVRLNDRGIGDLNRPIHSANEVPERIRLPVPAGLLRVGANHLRFTQTGRKADPEALDNLGLLGIALEFDPVPSGEGPP